MSGLDDISNLNESLTQGGKYTSNKSDLLGSFTELQENANEVIHSTIEQFLPGHFDAIDPSGAFHYASSGDDVSFVDTNDISLNILIDNFKYLAGQFNTALSTLKDDSGYGMVSGDSPTYDLSFGYATGTSIASKLSAYTDYDAPNDDDIYFVSRVNDENGSVAPSFQYSKLIDKTTPGTSGASDPRGFTDTNAPDHLQLTCGNLPLISSTADFWNVNNGDSSSLAQNKGNTVDNTSSTGDRLAIDNQSRDDRFGDDLTILDDADLLAARKRMCNPYNIIEDQDSIYNGGNAGKAGQKFATVTYLATQITALVEEMNRRITGGAKITDADGNEIALTLAQLNKKYDALLAENANVDANLETETLKLDSENLVYIGMLIATITVMAVGFTSLAKKTDMS